MSALSPNSRVTDELFATRVFGQSIGACSFRSCAHPHRFAKEVCLVTMTTRASMVCPSTPITYHFAATSARNTPYRKQPPDTLTENQGPIRHPSRKIGTACYKPKLLVVCVIRLLPVLRMSCMLMCSSARVSKIQNNQESKENDLMLNLSIHSNNSPSSKNGSMHFMMSMVLPISPERCQSIQRLLVIPRLSICLSGQNPAKSIG